MLARIITSETAALYASSLNKIHRSMSTTASHYESHSAADSYEEAAAYFNEPGAYMENLVALASNRLQLGTNNGIRRLLDVGGGTGSFSQALVDNDDSLEAIVVDPFLVNPNNCKDSDKVKFVQEPAEAFLKPALPEKDWWRTAGYHQVLLKEIVHHLKSQDRVKIFQRMQEEVLPLSKDVPSILITTRPKIDIDYPLWDAARVVWRKNQPSAEELCEELHQAGYVDINCTVETYPCQILLSRWQSMVRKRFWSTFAYFTDNELSDACAVIANEHTIDTTGNLNFEDRLVCISARKASE